jgi:Carboxypeptidase regulatory-like domain/Pvc16 N-terminal domain
LIEQATGRLQSWIEASLGSTAIVLRPPASEQEGEGVSLYLFELRPEPVARSTKLNRVEVSLRYLITAWGDSSKAHEFLDKLLVALTDHSDFQIEREPVPLEFWNALKVRPQPALVVRCKSSYDIPQRPPKLVRKVVMDTVEAASLTGVLLGPDNIPIAGALVEFPSLQANTKTDESGRFTFPLVPANGTGTLKIFAKGQELIVDLARAKQQTKPLSIQLNLEG